MATTYTTDAALAIPAYKDRNYHTPINADLAAIDALNPVGDLCVTVPVAERPTSTTLTVRVAGGLFVDRLGAVVTYAGITAQTVAASATTNLWLTEAGVIASGAAWPAGWHVRLAAVTADGTHVTGIADARVAWQSVGGRSAGAWYVGTADATVANTVTETTLVGAGWGSATVPANQLYAGAAVRVRASGVLSCTGTPTLNIKLKVGATVLVSTGAVALAGTVSNSAWMFEGLIICRTAGAGGTVRVQGRFWFDNAAHAGLMEGMPSTTTAAVDTTAANTLDLTATWGTAAAGNTITCSGAVIEGLN
jgi:hypothetical protein